MSTTFTTGQVAKLCDVAPRTVSKWFDSGRLRGYRIPGSQDRRIPRENLIAFLKENGMPMNGLVNSEFVIARVLLAGITDQTVIDAFTPKAGDDDWEPTCAQDAFEVGRFYRDADIVIIDCGMQDAERVIDRLQERKAAGCLVFAIRNPNSESLGESVDEEFGRPVDAVLLKERVLTFMRRGPRRKRKAS